MTSISRASTTDTYEYNANGNPPTSSGRHMTCRVEGGVIYKQYYNAENRISSIAKVNGNCETFTVIESWSYAYDGACTERSRSDGVRVGEAYFLGTTLTSTKSYYFGGAYETHSDSTIRKYYSLTGQTFAMRDAEGLKYFLTDHLGSTLAVLDSSGTVLSETRYMPFGAVRDDVGIISKTDFTYTFQRNMPYIKFQIRQRLS
ncbi:MAG: hypothetical protein HXY24_14270 [Rubrivivax sp.]|nr:hypothetical protein [Rubrivivax sp.]